MSRTTYIEHFSQFILALGEQSLRCDAVELFQWSIESLSSIVDVDCSWGGWADLTNGEVQLCASVSYNLPTNYEAFWSLIRKDDVLAHDVLRRRSCSAFYDRQGKRQTEGMIALADRFGIDKLAVVVSGDVGNPVSMFMSPYRSGHQSSPLTPEAVEFLRCALDHVRHAAERCSAAGAQDGAMLVDSAGRILMASPGATRMIGHHWPGWRRGYLPSELLQPVSPLHRRRLAERGLTVLRQECAHVLGQPLFAVTLRPAGPCDRMSPREKEIATLIAAGRTYKEIAALLSLSPATVRNRTQAILTKTGLHSKAALSSLLGSARTA